MPPMALSGRSIGLPGTACLQITVVPVHRLLGQSTSPSRQPMHLPGRSWSRFVQCNQLKPFHRRSLHSQIQASPLHSICRLARHLSSLHLSAQAHHIPPRILSLQRHLFCSKAVTHLPLHALLDMLSQLPFRIPSQPQQSIGKAGLELIQLCQTHQLLHQLSNSATMLDDRDQSLL